MMRRVAAVAAATALSVVIAGAALAGGGWPWRLPAGVGPPPVPAGNAMTRARVALGRRLFYDADLSINGTLSCATCHDQRQSFSDGVEAHPGAHGEPGLRNVPSLLNVAFAAPLTWGDPRLVTLEAQAVVPITGTSPPEMGMGGHEAEIGRRLSANPCYRLLFARAFPESGGRIDLDTVARALASFQRTIVGFDSAWDRAQAGKRPLDPDAARGERRFGASCGSCHSGANFTDYRLHYFPSSRRDRGEIRATGDTRDDGRFRTPSLRNVLLTAPYLHDGSAPTLGDAISRHGILMSAGDSAAIERFLAALTDRKVTRDRRFGPPPESCTVRG